MQHKPGIFSEFIQYKSKHFGLHDWLLENSQYEQSYDGQQITIIDYYTYNFNRLNGQ